MYGTIEHAIATNDYKSASSVLNLYLIVLKLYYAF